MKNNNSALLTKSIKTICLSFLFFVMAGQCCFAAQMSSKEDAETKKEQLINDVLNAARLYGCFDYMKYEQRQNKSLKRDKDWIEKNIPLFYIYKKELEFGNKENLGKFKKLASCFLVNVVDEGRRKLEDPGDTIKVPSVLPDRSFGTVRQNPSLINSITQAVADNFGDESPENDNRTKITFTKETQRALISQNNKTNSEASLSIAPLTLDNDDNNESETLLDGIPTKRGGIQVGLHPLSPLDQGTTSNDENFESSGSLSTISSEKENSSDSSSLEYDKLETTRRGNTLNQLQHVYGEIYAGRYPINSSHSSADPGNAQNAGPLVSLSSDFESSENENEDDEKNEEIVEEINTQGRDIQSEQIPLNSLDLARDLTDDETCEVTSIPSDVSDFSNDDNNETGNKERRGSVLAIGNYLYHKFRNKGADKRYSESAKRKQERLRTQKEHNLSSSINPSELDAGEKFSNAVAVTKIVIADKVDDLQYQNHEEHKSHRKSIQKAFIVSGFVVTLGWIISSYLQHVDKEDVKKTVSNISKRIDQIFSPNLVTETGILGRANNKRKKGPKTIEEIIQDVSEETGDKIFFQWVLFLVILFAGMVFTFKALGRSGVIGKKK